MNRFIFEDYKLLLNQMFKESVGGDRGQRAQLARHLGVHTTFVTHVLKGESHFSVEQALKICDFFSLNSLETDFFLQLLQFNRAGDVKTRAYFAKKLEVIRVEGLKLKVQLRKEQALTLDEQAVFYSDWIHSGIRLASALPEGGTIDGIAKLLNLDHRKVARTVEFLLKVGLCKNEKGRLTFGTQSTYVGSDSPFAKRLHDNWRLRSIQYGSSHSEDLMYTSAVTLTKEDFRKLREVLLETMKQFEKVTDDSDPQILAYINLDWVRVT